MKVAILTTDNRWPFNEYDRPTPWFGMAPEALLSGFTAFPEVEIHVISCVRQPVESPEKLAANIWFHSLHVPKVGWMRTGYLGCIRAVRRKLRDIRPDLVHGQGSEYEAAMCAAFSGFPNVITLLGIMKEMAHLQKARPGSFYWMASALESLALRRTQGVLANSRFTREKIRMRCRKTWLVSNAVREVFFSKPLATAAPPVPRLINVGVVSPNKRQNELLDVVEQLHRDGLDFEMEFIGGASGEDAYSARFLKRVRGLNRVSHHRFMPVSELMAAMDRSSALVHVSQIESFGLVVAEALARNLKVFAFDSGGVMDIVEGVAGAQGFGDGDWPGLKRAVSGWIKTGAPRSQTAADTMRQRFHPKEIARQHLEVYREILGRS